MRFLRTPRVALILLIVVFMGLCEGIMPRGK